MLNSYILLFKKTEGTSSEGISGNSRAVLPDAIIRNDGKIPAAYKMHDGKEGIMGKIVCIPLYMWIFYELPGMAMPIFVHCQQLRMPIH